ncbi:hypothetical protein L3Q82_016551, partial [Scortum barcoo]
MREDRRVKESDKKKEKPCVMPEQPTIQAINRGKIRTAL